MKIVHVISAIDPAKGGPQFGVPRMAAAQAALGHTVEIVSYASPQAKEKAMTAVAAVPGIDRIQWRLMPEPNRLERLLAGRAGRFIAKHIASADFVHLHGVWDPIIVRSAAAAKRLHIPYCVCPHGLLDSWSLSQKAWKKKLAMLFCHRAMLTGARFIHALNPDEMHLIERLSLATPIYIIPNGVFPQEFAELPSALVFREQMGLGEGRRFVLFMSRLHFKKGLDVLAKAFASVAGRFPEVDLIVAGPDDGARKDFQKLVRQFDIENRVRLIGPVYGPAKLEALSAAACFCLPSRQEGFSMAITEALACSIPVVISDACHFPEVADAAAGLVTPVDPAAVSTALTQVLADEPKARAMGASGRKLVLENFTWPVIAEKMIYRYCLSA
jgi:glycosyltransferase involved in cell wall biosynthesis